MENSFQKSIQHLVDIFEVSLDEEIQDQWVKFAELTIEANKKTNLVSVKSVDSVCEILFADALAVLKLQKFKEFPKRKIKLIDVGAGGGAPTIPLLLALPNLHGTLVEPRSKREAFLHWVVAQLAVQNRTTVIKRKINPQNPRIENTPLDIAASRATFPPTEWANLGTKLAKKTLFFTRPQIEIDFPDGSQILEQLNYKLPSNQSARSLYLTSNCTK